MIRLGRLPCALLGMFALTASTVWGQGNCQNQFQYPSGGITPNADGTVTTISTCSFESEYSLVTGIQAGATYRFVLASQGWITVRQGTPDGPVVAQGYHIVDVLAASTADLYSHWNIDETCATQSECVVTTVQYFGNCGPVLATASVQEDCDNQQFSVVVDVVSTGSGSTVNVAFEAPSGSNTFTGLGTGPIVLGPFFFGESVNVQVQHESDAACSMDLGSFQESGECPLSIFCGAPASSFSYCYANSETKVWNYVSEGGSGSLVLTFLSGSIQAFGDVLTIYDGTDDSGPVLYTNPGGLDTDLGGVIVASTTGALHLTLTTDDFGSCADEAVAQWNWEVQCLNCQLPQASMTAVDDCPNNQFSVEVNVTSLGDASSVNIIYAVNGGGAQTVSGAGLGTTVLGPFTINDDVAVIVQHGFDPACSVALGSITDSDNCPTLIVCGAQPLVETFCYNANELRDWRYQSVGSGTLRLTFNRGTIESNTWDDLAIYDGTDNTGTLLFVHSNATTYNLGPVGSAVNNTLTNYYGVQVYSTTGSLYMEMSSDGSVQCGQPFPNETYDSWEWEVVCLDCAIPAGTVAIVDDCANHQFSLDVDITGTGDAASATVLYTVNGGAQQSVTGAGLGITTIGPFEFGDVVNVVIAHESNSLCNIPKGNFSETGTCPELITCGTPFEVSSCYVNNNDLRWYFQGTGSFPLGIFFNQGTVFTGDLIQVYDGGDITAPLLYSGNGTNQNVAGLFFYTTNPDHRLCVRLLANGFTDCASAGTQNPVEFSVDCLDCVPPTGTFSIVQDCANFQYSVAVNLTSLGSAASMAITNNGGAAVVTATAPGTYTVGPFTSGTPVQVVVENASNSLCNIYSGTLVNPLCPTILCGASPLTETYCYNNNENRAWAWAAPSPGATLNLAFQRGTIESNTWDRLVIHDGPDATAPILFQHGAATSNLGPVGSAVNSTAIYETVNVTSTQGNLYMTLVTDASVSCASSTATYDSWIWDVTCIGCSAPGVSYNLVPDCRSREYTAEVIITAPPSAQGMTIQNVLTGQSQSITTTGVYTFGPYRTDTTAIFGITDLSEPGCTWLSDTLTYASVDCHIVSCGSDNYEWCYGNNDDRWYTFRSALPVPTTIAFQQGQMLTGDRIVIYNGADETAGVIYQGNNGGNLSGFAVNSQNPANTITLRIQGNASGSCSDGQATLPLRWSVACGAVGMEELASAGFMVFPNPTEGQLSIVVDPGMAGSARLRVLDMSGRTVMESPIVLRPGAVHGIDMRELQTGQYAVQLSTQEWTKVQRVQVAR